MRQEDEEEEVAFLAALEEATQCAIEESHREEPRSADLNRQKRKKKCVRLRRPVGIALAFYFFQIKYFAIYNRLIYETLGPVTCEWCRGDEPVSTVGLGGTM